MNKIRFIIGTSLIGLMLSSCVTRGKIPDDKIVKYDEAYRVGGFPVFAAREVKILISGKLILEDALQNIPNKLKVELYNKDGKLVAEAIADSEGEFLLHGDLPRGEYKIQLASAKYFGEVKVTIDSPKLESVRLVVFKKGT